ncbi:leucyl/phenylalanyl-tRNA--protein transferase [Aliidiomarina minuta]|uniref:Leucyl/phenylalanyl-tRNA--protein transferase n=1 Tax=Aliidiomarina minuta TaxID=880057 RepID=A0A432W772_9GAMM|nr:leucyl/phenylalanyl-tRNA--protein transferase [Aliidiomarina minuta]
MLAQLSSHQHLFPDPRTALPEPNGLLAVGGDLSPQRLLKAYHQGIFPWFSPEDPILWWSPDPRGVIMPHQLHVSRSLRKFLRRCNYQCSINKAFPEVIQACADQRAELEGTWITGEMEHAYTQLHEMGHAHSIEVWQGDRLIGGLYGVLVGQTFCGESMFHRADNASKIALLALREHLLAGGLRLIDCQLPSLHLNSLGAIEMPRERFLHTLALGVDRPMDPNLLVPQAIDCAFIGNSV